MLAQSSKSSGLFKLKLLVRIPFYVTRIERSVPIFPFIPFLHRHIALFKQRLNPNKSRFALIPKLNEVIILHSWTNKHEGKSDLQLT